MSIRWAARPRAEQETAALSALITYPIGLAAPSTLGFNEAAEAEGVAGAEDEVEA